MARKTINTGNIQSSGPIAAQNWMHKLYAGIRALPKQRPDAQRSFNVEPPTATIDPETVETGLLDGDERIVLASSVAGFLFQLRQASKQPCNITAR